MPQLNIYVTERLARTIRSRAKAQGKSLSEFVTGVLEEKLQPKAWDEAFFKKVMGSWKGEFPAIDRPLPEERQSL